VEHPVAEAGVRASVRDALVADCRAGAEDRPTVQVHRQRRAAAVRADVPMRRSRVSQRMESGSVGLSAGLATSQQSPVAGVAARHQGAATRCLRSEVRRFKSLLCVRDFRLSSKEFQTRRVPAIPQDGQGADRPRRYHSSAKSPGRHEQDQEAGDNSEQQQAARDIINITQVGVSAANVIAITRSETKRIIEGELTPAAERIAHERLDQFEQKMIDRFAEDPQLRKAFADPDFQCSLRDASRAAASNDDDHTEDLLVDLLANRAAEGNSARLRLITSRAIQAADKLSIEALRPYGRGPR
jgi:hypothetical protein